MRNVAEYIEFGEMEVHFTVFANRKFFNFLRGNRIFLLPEFQDAMSLLIEEANLRRICMIPEIFLECVTKL
jgi:hypothetical protein